MIFQFPHFKNKVYACALYSCDNRNCPLTTTPRQIFPSVDQCVVLKHTTGKGIKRHCPVWISLNGSNATIALIGNPSSQYRIPLLAMTITLFVSPVQAHFRCAYLEMVYFAISDLSILKCMHPKFCFTKQHFELILRTFVL